MTAGCVDLRLTPSPTPRRAAIEAVRTDPATYDLPPGLRAQRRVTPAGGLRRRRRWRSWTCRSCARTSPRIGRSSRCTPCRGRARSRSGAAPARTASSWLTTLRPAGADRARWSRDSLSPGPTSRFDLGNVAGRRSRLSARSRASPTSRCSAAPTRSRSRARPASGRCCRRASAELIAPGRYRLTRLLRGQRGTEGAMGNPAPAGARVVVLDDGAGAAADRRGRRSGCRGTGASARRASPVSDRAYRRAGLHARGRRAAAVLGRPCRAAVAHAARRPAISPSAGPAARARSPADSWSAAEVPLAEEREAYEVEILDGATVKRTLSTATTSAIYTAAQQTADWGALLGPGDTLDRPHLPALRPRRAGRAENRHAQLLKAPMSDTSTHLLLPYILAAQAQKHVTHNEALRLLDGLVQLSVLDRRPDRAARQPRRRRPLHRRLGRHRRLGGLGPQRRALDRRRLDAPAAAARLAGVGRGRGPAAGLRRRGLDRHHARGAAEPRRCSGSARQRMRRTRSRPSSTPRSGRRRPWPRAAPAISSTP